MSPTSLSAEGALVRQDIQVLQELMEKPHPQNHILEVYMSRLDGSLQVLQHACLKTESDREESFETLEELTGALQANNTARNSIIEKCAFQQDIVETLVMRIFLIMSQSGTKMYADHDEWARRFLLVLELNAAANELDVNIKEMQVNEAEARALEAGRQHGRTMAEKADLWEEYKPLEKEVDEVLSQARQIRD